LHDLAVAYKAGGRLDEAIPLLEKVVQQEKVKPHPNFSEGLTSMRTLARMYQDVGRLDDALALFEQAAKEAEARFGPDHAVTLKCRVGLGVACWSAKQFDRSVPMFEEIVRRTEAKYGPGDAECILQLTNLGVNYRDAGRHKDAIRTLENALGRACKYSGLSSDMLESTQQSLWGAYNGAGQPERAEPMYRQTVEEVRRQFGKDHLRTADALGNCGQFLLILGQPAQAEPVLRDCLAIRRAKDPGGWQTYDAAELLGEALLRQRKFAEAEPLLIEGYEGLKQRQNNVHPNRKWRVTNALYQVVTLYEQWGKKDEAAKWRAGYKKATAKPPAKPSDNK
jgi:tetratricopeptide (TPR) repeat protein